MERGCLQDVCEPFLQVNIKEEYPEFSDNSVDCDPDAHIEVKLTDERPETCFGQLAEVGPIVEVDKTERLSPFENCEPFLHIDIKEEYPGSTHSVMEASESDETAITSHFCRVEDESQISRLIEQQDYLEEGIQDLQHVHYTSDYEDSTTVNAISRFKDNSHRGDNSANLKPNQCGHCDESFAQKSSLTIHIRKHTTSKPYQCEICNKSFTRKGHLVIHNRIHTGSKPYQCGHCDKSFSQKSTLVVHTRIHTGSKPYQCGHCDKSFKRKGDLLIHLQLHLHYIAHNLQEQS